MNVADHPFAGVLRLDAEDIMLLQTADSTYRVEASAEVPDSRTLAVQLHQLATANTRIVVNTGYFQSPDEDLQNGPHPGGYVDVIDFSVIGEGAWDAASLR